MTFFIPEGAEWNWLSRDATKQRVLAGTAAAAGLTGLSSFIGRGMPSFRRKYNYISRNNKRQRVRRIYNRGLARLARRKRGTSGRGLTFEHDRQFIYKKKSMPKRKKRRWKRFVKKVGAVNERELGTRMVLFNKSIEFVAPAISTLQGLLNFTLYGWSSGASNETWTNDLAYMAELENDGNPTAALGDRVGDNARMIFTSAVLDLTLRNTTTFNNEGVSELSSDATLEVDVYEMSARKMFELNNVNYNLLSQVLDLASAGIYDQNVTATGTRISIFDRGATPFECPIGLRRYGIKVWKKTKFFLRSGQTLTYQVRDPTRHVGYRSRLGSTSSGANGGNKPGWTKHVFCVFKLIPGLTVGTGPSTYQPKIHAGVTRKYMYKVEGLSEDRTIKVTR